MFDPPEAHGRRLFRRWRCRCGRRFPCGPFLDRRDAQQATVLTGWRIGPIAR